MEGLVEEVNASIFEFIVSCGCIRRFSELTERQFQGQLVSGAYANIVLCIHIWQVVEENVLRIREAVESVRQLCIVFVAQFTDNVNWLQVLEGELGYLSSRQS